jgi:hypothetical protein
MTALLVATVGAGPASAASDGNSEVADLCQKDGWQGVTTADGAAFVNQGACVRYGAHGGTYDDGSPDAGTRAFCEQVGGTFTAVDDGSSVLWRCETAAVFPESDLGEFSRRCVDDDGGQYTVATFRPDGSEDPYLVECMGAA